jgi:hypothetical protein
MDMEALRSKFRISALERTIEIEGSEQFVSKQLEEMKELIIQFSLQGVCETTTATLVSSPGSFQGNPAVTHQSLVLEVDSASSTSSVSPFADYLHIFENLNGAIRIVCDIPGESKRMQMKNAMLIYGYASHLLGRDQFPADEVRQLCLDHGFLDPKNFAISFDDKTTFLSEGPKGGKKNH